MKHRPFLKSIQTLCRKGLLFFMPAIAALYLLAACSVQKRKYRHGFYIHTLSKSKSEPGKHEKQVSTGALVTCAGNTGSTSVVPPASIVTAQTAAVLPADLAFKRKAFQQLYSASNHNIGSHLKKVFPVKAYTKEEEPKKKVSIAMIVGLVFSILGNVIFLGGLVVLTGGAYAGFLLLFMGGVFLLAAFILCITGLIQKLSEPPKYRAWPIIVTLVFCLPVFLLILLLLASI